MRSGNHKLGKIASALERGNFRTDAVSPSTLSGWFCRKTDSGNRKNPEKSRKGLYFIVDNFISFPSFRYVYPLKVNWNWIIYRLLDEMQKDFETSLFAFTYEDICKDLFMQIYVNREQLILSPSRIRSLLVEWLYWWYRNRCYGGG